MIELNGPGDLIRKCEFQRKIKINIYLFIYLLYCPYMHK